MGELRFRCVFLAEMGLDERKQARRTGMAGPLGEMFDHGMTLHHQSSLHPLTPTNIRLRRFEHHGKYTLPFILCPTH